LKSSYRSLLIAAWILSGCVSDPDRGGARRSFFDRPLKEQQVYLDFFRESFAQWKNNKFKFPPRFFIALDTENAPQDLLRRLRDEGYEVRDGSKWREGEGIRCDDGKIEWLSPSKVRLRGGYIYGSVGGQWGAFILQRKAEHWKIIAFKVEVVA